MNIKDELIKYAMWYDRATMPDYAQTDKDDIIQNVESYLQTDGNKLHGVPDWYKELSLLELQMQELKYDMPKNLIERRGCVTDLETFDMKLTAMQNVLHRAFEELKGSVV